MNLTVKLKDLQFKNPLIAASGTFGFGREYEEYFDLNILGGISGKGITPDPRTGNPPPRIAETPSGILNSVGLQNPGLMRYISEELGYLSRFDIINIANVAANTIDEYCMMVSVLSQEEAVDAIELNVSCPNVKTGCLAFGTDEKELDSLLSRVRQKCGKPLIIKLTPNTDKIVKMARICEDNGADAISAVNTILGLAIDINTRRPVLKNNFGGLSGPCIKPIALRIISQIYSEVSIPVIGMGGISNHLDVIEFMLAGSALCMIGTANMRDPLSIPAILEGLLHYCLDNAIDSISSLTGSLRFYREGDE